MKMMKKAVAFLMVLSMMMSPILAKAEEVFFDWSGLFETEEECLEWIEDREVELWQADLDSSTVKQRTDHNQKMISQLEELYSYNPDAFLTYNDESIGTGFASLEDYHEIRNIADKITQGIDNDYGKVVAVHDWICSNIYYDMTENSPEIYFDEITQSAAFTTSKTTVWKRKAGVCASYTWLCEYMLRYVGIPTVDFVVVVNDGVGCNGSFVGSHSINASRINGKWVLFDTTYDSLLELKNNVYEKPANGVCFKTTYFDMSIEQLSENKVISFIANNYSKLGSVYQYRDFLTRFSTDIYDEFFITTDRNANELYLLSLDEYTGNEKLITIPDKIGDYNIQYANASMFYNLHDLVESWETWIDIIRWESKKPILGCEEIDTYNDVVFIVPKGSKKDYDKVLKNRKDITIVEEGSTVLTNALTVKANSYYIKVAKYPDCTYSLDGKKWQDSNVFYNVTPKKTYTVYVKSDNTVLKQRVKTKSMLTSTRNKITVAKNSDCEYSIDGKNWQKSNVFTGLKSHTKYTIYRRLISNKKSIVKESIKTK